MFINNAELKKQLKSAWKRNDLVISKDGNYYHVKFGWASLQVDANAITNKAKAMLVELVGDIADEPMLYGESCAPQLHLDTFEDLINKYAGSSHLCEGTMVMLNHGGNLNMVMQDSELNKYLLAKEYIDLLSLKEVDKESGESDPGLPVYEEGYFVWINNVMALRVPATNIAYEADKIVLSLSVDLTCQPLG